MASIKRLFRDEKFNQDFIVITTLTFSIIVSLGIWVVILLYLRQTEPIIPLHYTIYFGIDLVGPASRLLVFPVGATVITIINSVIALFLFKKKKLLSHTLLIGGATSILVMALSIYFILRIQTI